MAYIDSNLIEMELKRRAKGICLLCAKYECCIDNGINRKGSHTYCWQPLQLPTADVVEVVRCKDCVYAQERYGHLECINGISYRNSWNKPDDYCNYGERKEDE